MNIFPLFICLFLTLFGAIIATGGEGGGHEENVETEQAMCLRHLELGDDRGKTISLLIDGKESAKISFGAALLSKTLSVIVEDEMANPQTPIEEVEPEILAKMVEWCEVTAKNILNRCLAMEAEKGKTPVEAEMQTAPAPEEATVSNPTEAEKATVTTPTKAEAEPVQNPANAPPSNAEVAEAKESEFEDPNWAIKAFDHYVGDKNKQEFWRLVLVANYLAVKDLLKTLCDAVEKKIEGKTPAEIRKILHVKDDFVDPKEKERIDKLNAWYFDPNFVPPVIPIDGIDFGEDTAQCIDTKGDDTCMVVNDDATVKAMHSIETEAATVAASDSVKAMRIETGEEGIGSVSAQPMDIGQ